MDRFICKLASRGVVRVGGSDKLKFLQSLVTTDMHSICSATMSCSPAGFLDRRGRLLFGTLIYSTESGDYLIDIARDRKSALVKHLKLFRLRSAVEIDDVSDNYAVWQFVTPLQKELPSYVGRDARLPEFGGRAVLETTFTPNENIPQRDETDFERLRILKAVPDGSDFEPGTLPLDIGLHLINGVSFNKGCYLGQELTARTHFTGVLRKRLTALIAVPQDNSQDIFNDSTEAMQYLTQQPDLLIKVGDKVYKEGRSEKIAGKITSAIDNVGLSVLRMTDAFDPKSKLHLEDGRRVCTIRQRWWELANQREKENIFERTD